MGFLSVIFGLAGSLLLGHTDIGDDDIVIVLVAVMLLVFAGAFAASAWMPQC